MDPEEIRAHCAKASIKQMDVCLIGEGSAYACRGVYPVSDSLHR
jgi:hypothetical protein